jgi:hypothetical protein
MSTVSLLMARFGARAVIPIDEVCREYFAPVTLPNISFVIVSTPPANSDQKANWGNAV